MAVLAARRLIRRPALGSVLSNTETDASTTSEKWLPTSCLNCSTRCATRVRVVNGKAVKISGNPLSRVSEGENCPRAHIGLQVLYDPDRIKGPLKRKNPLKGKGVDPEWTPISWNQALNEAGRHLKALRDNGQPHQLAIFYGLNAVSDEDIIRRFADAYGTPNIFSEDSLEDEAIKAGGWMADGHYTQSAYDLARTNYILAFGASILESEKPLARNLRMWGKIRRERPNRAKVVVIDPRYSVTAARADRWLPINPGTEGALAMAIANVILSEDLYDPNFLGGWAEGVYDYKELALNYYSPETVAGITGIPADTIREIAREFGSTRPAVAWRGKGATVYPNGAYNSYAIYCLNALVGSINMPGGVLYQKNPDYRPMPEITEDDISRAGKSRPRLDLTGTERFPIAEAAINQVADSIADKRPYPVEMAIGFNSNLNMSAPGNWRWHLALKEVPYYVHIAASMSEMAEYADIVLPACTFLEQWGYDHSPPGSGFAELKIKQPVVVPRHESRSTTDIVFEIARGLGGAVVSSFSGIGDGAEGFVKYRTGDIAPWDELLRDGVSVDEWAYEFHKYESLFKTPSGKFEFKSGNLEARLKELGIGTDGLTCLPHYERFDHLGDIRNYPLLLSTYQPLLNIESGSQNYPWAQEVFLVMHGQGWTNFAEMNIQTAHAYGIRDGDMVWVESPFGRIRVRARVFEGILPQVVSIASGQGHYNNGRWANGIGVNPNDIIGVDYDRLSGQSAFFNTRVRVYKA